MKRKLIIAAVLAAYLDGHGLLRDGVWVPDHD